MIKWDADNMLKYIKIDLGCTVQCTLYSTDSADIDRMKSLPLTVIKKTSPNERDCILLGVQLTVQGLILVLHFPTANFLANRRSQWSGNDVSTTIPIWRYHMNSFKA